MGPRRPLALFLVTLVAGAACTIERVGTGPPPGGTETTPVDSGVVVSPDTGVVLDSGRPDTGVIPPTCSGGYDCLTPPPAGWDRVDVFRFPTGGGAVPPSVTCSVGGAAEAGWTAPRADPASCSSCTCSKTACTVSLECHNGPADCLAGTVTNLAVTTACSAAQTPTNATTSCVPKGSVAGTGCTPSTVTVTRPPPWGERDFVCAGGATAGACGQGKVCVAKPVTGATSCIRKAGATACPGDPWTAAVSLYPDAFVDGRGCSACGCTPTGIGCSADVTVYGCSATCTATAPCPAPAAQAIGACADLSAVVGPPNTTNWTAKVTSGPTVTGTCAKTGGSPNGQVQRGTPDLVCCVP